MVKKLYSQAQADPENKNSLKEGNELTITGFAFEKFERKGLRYIYATDYTKSYVILCKCPFEPDIPSIIRFRGTFFYDEHIGDYVIAADEIYPDSDFYPRDEAKEKRVELHIHTKMSAVDSTVDISAASELIKNWGHDAAAVTDSNCLHAYPEFEKASEIYGFKPIYGCEINITEKNKVYSTTIIVRNRKGLKNLYKIITDAHLNAVSRVPITTFEKLSSFREGLLISAGSLKSIVAELYTCQEYEQAKERMEFFDYLEVFPILAVTDKRFNTQKLKEYYNFLYDCASEMKKPVVMSGDVHYLRKEDKKLYDALVYGTRTAKNDRKIINSERFLRTTADMFSQAMDIFDDEKKAYLTTITNSRLISSMTEKFSLFPDKVCAPQMGNTDSFIIDVMNCAREVYGTVLHPLIEKRLSDEVQAIIKSGYAVMFTLSQKIVAHSEQAGYPVVSRGTAASSLVAFVMGITGINPLKPHYYCKECSYVEFRNDCGSGYDLTDKKCPYCGELMKKDGHNIRFEIFLGGDGKKPPDIDLNFSGEYQSQVHCYLTELFGRDRCFKAGTINASSYRLARRMAEKYQSVKPFNSAEKAWIIHNLMNVRITTGQHPGGMVIIPSSMQAEDFTPVQYPSDDRSKELLTTHFDYEAIEKQLLKVDALGHDGPTFLKRLTELTRYNHEDIPMNDAKVIKMFSSPLPMNISLDEIGIKTGTVGIPEVWTPYAQKMLLETRPQNFHDLIRTAGLSHGSNIWFNNAKELIMRDKKLKEDVISCRDDILEYLEKFSVPRDIILSIIQKVKKGSGVDEQTKRVLRDKNVPQWYINSCDRIRYLFPKAHSVSYMVTSYKIAFYKLYFPLEFYSVYFSIHAWNFDVMNIKSSVKTLFSSMENKENKGQYYYYRFGEVQTAYEMIKRGYSFLKPDIYTSAGFDFIINGNSLRVPLVKIGKLGPKSIAKILEQRKIKFTSKEDFINRTKLSASVTELLEQNGVLNFPRNSVKLKLF